MYLLSLGPELFVPFLVFAIPIIAIAGGITAGIVRTLGQQRLIELAQRERIAMIEKGIDPSKLPALPQMPVGRGFGGDDLSSIFASQSEYSRRRSQGLMIGGLVTLAVGVSVAIMLGMLGGTDENAWAVGLVPASVGVALLISAWIVRPRDEREPGAPPRSGSV